MECSVLECGLVLCSVIMVMMDSIDRHDDTDTEMDGIGIEYSYGRG